jgi:hypothetical protein
MHVFILLLVYEFYSKLHESRWYNLQMMIIEKLLKHFLFLGKECYR